MQGETLLYLTEAAVVLFFLIIYQLWILHDMIVGYGSYPHDIALNGTYTDKAKYTIYNRISWGKTLLAMMASMIITNTITILLTAGIIHLTTTY